MPAAFDPGPLAIGTAPIGGLYSAVPDATATAMLHAAVDAGITHFDSAPHYGRGLAEARLGAFLSTVDRSARLTVSTKVGRRVRSLSARPSDDVFLGAPPGESVFDFTPEGVRAELAESRARLGRDFVDLVLVHDPDEHLEEVPAAVEELARQRDAGDIGAIGVGTNSAAVVEHLLDRVPLDAVLLAGRITLLESSGDEVAERYAGAGVTLLAAGVFQSGILAGADGDTYDYLPAPAAVRRRVEALRDACRQHGTTLHRAAINFPRRIPGVTTTLVGVRSPEELSVAVDAFGANLPDELWQSIDALRDADDAAAEHEGERS